MRTLIRLGLPAAAASLLLAACGSGSYNNPSAAQSGGGSQGTNGAAGVVVKTATAANLGTVLANARGLTLYHLSGERNGKFLCTSAACLGVWHPLAGAPGGGAVAKVGSLGTVKRPDGTTQVTYKGAPLYTFARDSKAGEANGQGIKDVGTWTAASTGAQAPAHEAPAASSGSSGSSGAGESSGGGYRY
jgi:predicted lipoprotein with Yx(FWY)xxD motif